LSGTKIVVGHPPVRTPGRRTPCAGNGGHGCGSLVALGNWITTEHDERVEVDRVQLEVGLSAVNINVVLQRAAEEPVHRDLAEPDRLETGLVVC